MRLRNLSFTLLFMFYPIFLYAQQGVFVYQVTVHMRPPFYKGQMPLNYQEGKRPLGGGFTGGLDIVYWHEYSGWKNEFSYSSTLILEEARAESASGETLARATMKEIDKEKHQIIFREQHFGPGGRVTFECLSAYSIGTSFKVAEYGQRGTKKREFFFLLPV